MPEIHLTQSATPAKHWLTCSACGPSTKNKERIKKFMKTGNTCHIYRN